MNKLKINLHEVEFIMDENIHNILIIGDNKIEKTSMINKILTSIQEKFILIKDRGIKKEGSFGTYIYKEGKDITQQAENTYKRSMHSIGHIHNLENMLAKEFNLRDDIENKANLIPMIINLDGIDNILSNTYDNQYGSQGYSQRLNYLLKHGPKVQMYFIMSNTSPAIDLSNFYIQIKIKNDVQEIKCNTCDWIGKEEDLVLVVETEGSQENTTYELYKINNYNENNKNQDLIKGCPKCLTDKGLMDLK